MAFSERISQGKIFKVWVILTILTAVLGALFGGLTGVMIAMVVKLTGGTLADIERYARYGGYVMHLPASYLIFRWVMGKYIFPEDDEIGGEPELGV